MDAHAHPIDDPYFEENFDAAGEVRVGKVRFSPTFNVLGKWGVWDFAFSRGDELTLTSSSSSSSHGGMLYEFEPGESRLDHEVGGSFS